MSYINPESSVGYLLLFYNYGICQVTLLWGSNNGTVVFSLSLDDVISMMDDMILVLHFCRVIFTVKSISRIYGSSICRIRGSSHNKEFLLQKYKMCL